MIVHKLARLLLAVTVLSCAAVSFSMSVDEDVSAVVASNWLSYVVHQQGAWGGMGTPTLVADEPFVFEGELLAYLYRVVPRGYVMVPARRELSPVTAYSETTHLPSREPGGFFDMLRETIRDRVGGLPRLDGTGKCDDVPAHPAWDDFTLPPEDFAVWLDDDDPEWEGAGPLLETQWEQCWPFNLYCPPGESITTYVGCTGLALAQLLRYHEWPRRGFGNVSYWWDGDTHCGDDTGGTTINANFMVPYDWSRMPETMNWETPVDQQEAVAELCFNAAAALLTDFSACGSSASLSRATSALVNYFDYEYGAREYPRFRYSDTAWFSIIRNEIDGGRPVLYASTIHSMVCDGWREADDMLQIHINYGWGGDSDNWYCLDDIETSGNPAAERMVAGIRPACGAMILTPDLHVVREDDAAVLSWGDGSLSTTMGFHIWRGCDADDRERLTQLALAGSTEYVWVDQCAPSQGVSYWLEVLLGGTSAIWVGPEDLTPLSTAVEAGALLSATVSNPFTPMSEISFALPRDARVSAEVYDLAGRRVAVLLDAALPAGPRRIAWDGRDMSGQHAPSGVYLLRLAFDGRARTHKITLAR